MIELYKNIKKYRLYNKWSQTALAHKVGYSDKSMISKIEKGDVDLSQSQIWKFADAFGITASELFGTTVEPHSIPPISPDLKLSETEREIIEAYRTFNEEGQYKVLDYVRLLERDGSYIKTGDYNDMAG